MLVLKFQKLQKKSNQLPKTGFITFVARFKGVESIPLLHFPVVGFQQNLRTRSTTFDLQIIFGLYLSPFQPGGQILVAIWDPDDCFVPGNETFLSTFCKF